MYDNFPRMKSRVIERNIQMMKSSTMYFSIYITIIFFPMCLIFSDRLIKCFMTCVHA